MNPPSTTGTRYAGQILGEPLADWVAERRTQGKSWEAIARDLARTTEDEVVYSGEHLRRLFAPVPSSSSGDAA